eukprot:CAMPEP_0201701568 /NCGR_PEP_ID=MMETSP0578-20130828/33175_1 /ASSEMBLY_ACC=CAM_ASM_000663 /TAXON_ID=267565 /ORGANISM="Skeletonema grethea, Strain CCMP 1804" /LENGTH=426 /DNA_ID=CAMNT_0048188917 /DNA_START=89 /DNA_END=1365 /DNA_ORIENTATION=-
MTRMLLLLLLVTLASAQDLSCVGCIGGTKKCVGDTTIQMLDDVDCIPCLKRSGKWTWPCNVEGLCWCWDSSKPKYKPALSSGLEPALTKPCDIFTESMFDKIAPNAVHPYTYDGLCDAIEMLNDRYDEKIFMMGTLLQQKQEWAAFLGHTTHESAQYTAPREALVCGRTVEKLSGTFCKPCDNKYFDWDNRYCKVSLVANGQFYDDYCDKVITPPHGCVCGPTTEVDGDIRAGLMNPNAAYFGRGAIQLSWNSNYIKASQVLTESAETLCTQPDLVATEPKYAWGTALWFWVFSKPPGEETNCHIKALEGSFGSTLRIINGGLECPPDAYGYHAEAVVTRLRYYCIAASIMEVPLMDFGGCEGLGDAFARCVQTGFCPECNEHYGNPTMEPSLAPAPQRPTPQPTDWGSWRSEDWLTAMRGNSAAV